MMRIRTLALALGLGFIAACAHGPGTEQQPIPVKDSAETLGPAIDDVLKDVQSALIDVQDDPTLFETLPALALVELSLSSSYDSGGKLKVNLLVFSAGGGQTANETSKLTITLKPPAEDATKEISSRSISDSLYELIKAAAIGVADVGRASEENRYPLETAKLVAELSFGFVETGEGGISFEVAPISVEAGGDAKTHHVQKIKLIFGK